MQIEPKASSVLLVLPLAIEKRKKKQLLYYNPADFKLPTRSRGSYLLLTYEFRLDSRGFTHSTQWTLQLSTHIIAWNASAKISGK